MSDKVIKIGMLRIELHLAFDGVGAAIWEDDDLLRPTKRTLRLSLNGKEMKTLVDGVNSFYANKQPVGPTPHPVATLCEVVDGLLRDDHFWAGYKEDSVRLYHALSAERKRAVLVENLIDAARRFYQENDGRYDLLRARLSELDAFDRGAENG